MKKIKVPFAARIANLFLITAMILAVGTSFLFSPVVGCVIGALQVGSMLMPNGVAGANTFEDTLLFDARAEIVENKQKKFDLRPVMSNVLPAFTKDREYTIPDLAAIRESENQTTTALYMKRGSFTTSTSGKSCSPSGATTGSAKVDLEWVQLSVTVKSSYKKFKNNLISQKKALAHDLYEAEKQLWYDLDVALLAFLEAEKSVVNLGSGYGGFDQTNGIYAIDLQYENRFYNIVEAHMKKNNYNPTFTEISDTMWSATRDFYANQATANSTNTAFQFKGFTHNDSNIITAPDTIDANTYNSIHYIIPDGGVSILSWNDPLNREGDQSGESYWSTYQSIIHPEFTFDLFKKTACGDTSTEGGGKQDKTENYELTLWYAIAKQPDETAGATPIFKYGTLNDNTFTT